MILCMLLVKTPMLIFQIETNARSISTNDLSETNVLLHARRLPLTHPILPDNKTE